MSKARSMMSLLIACGTAACTAPNEAPVVVATPGLPSPELALQRSIDKVHDFLSSLNDRIETPARVQVALATSPVAGTPGTPIVLEPAAALPITSRKPSPGREASPLYGRHDVVWFAYGDGFPRITCATSASCVVRLQRGEALGAAELATDKPAGWHIEAVHGTRGIHAGSAVVLSPGSDARAAILHFSTDRRSYALALDASGPSMRSVAFTYADTDPTSQAEPPASGNSAALAANDGGAPDFAYQLVGPETPWKPMRVYSDGTHTYIQFPPGGITTAPRLVIVAPHGNGTDSYRTVGDSYVIDGRVTDALLIGTGPGAPTIHITHGGRA